MNETFNERYIYIVCMYVSYQLQSLLRNRMKMTQNEPILISAFVDCNL